MKTRQKKEWQTFLDWNVPKPAEIQRVHKERLNLPAEGAVSVGREMAQVANPDPPRHPLAATARALTRKGGKAPGRRQGPGWGKTTRNLPKLHLAPKRITEILQMGMEGSCGRRRRRRR